MDDLDKQIEEAKERLKKTQQLAELNLLQKQAAAISPQAQQTNQNDPMQKMMKWAFPVGGALAVIGIIVYLPLHNFTLGLTLDGVAAAIIGVKLAMTPSIRIPIIDDLKKKQQPKSQEEGHYIPIKGN